MSTAGRFRLFENPAGGFIRGAFDLLVSATWP
jgi:hypothetical protein